MEAVLSHFHPFIKDWFEKRHHSPTDIQLQSWPLIASGEHLLITAPTGSGKTLTAFLWAINQLVSGEWSCGQPRVLYVSPLKALNNDIRRNLIQPLEEIRSIFEAAGQSFPDIRVFTRSGDTPQSERRRMLRHPPEILITTPESLNLLLSSKSGLQLFTALTTVILDEIHAVIGEKRGVHLITAVDRLIRLSGEFQRIALSATVNPLEPVAAFVGGYQKTGPSNAPSYQPREVRIVRSDTSKQLAVEIRYPEQAFETEIDDLLWSAFAEAFKDIISGNRSTLLFANSRKLSEKLTYKINSAANQVVAYAHHGSLSREIREEVEQKLKNGELRAIVATSSLEMGIDIGHLDEVILIQSPPSISSAIQRIGRAGHQVGEVSRGIIFPSHAQDFVSAAVLVSAVEQRDIEPLHPVNCPLDVLAQVLISMTGTECWELDDLFHWIRASFPYHHLPRKQFDLTLNMLAGRYAETRIRELKPRVSIDRLDNTVEAKKGALMAVYMSGGTIPDRGYYQLRHQESGARIGELDEEYVWEARIGQLATIGTQNWRIQRITHNDVYATPVGQSIMNTPFWKSEDYGRGFHYSRRILEFLETADGRLEDPAFRAELGAAYHMTPAAVRELIDFLRQQKEVTRTSLPHRHHLLLEYVLSGPDGAPGSQLVLHTLWGGKVNKPFVMALDAAWEEAYGERLEIFPGNDCIVMQLARPIEADKLLSLVTSDTLETLLKKRLEGSGFFGARFRECAGRALLITRNRINQRMPLWMTRLRSQKLLESVLKYDDFPILLETWRSCLQDEFDLPALKQMLEELETGAISWSITQTSHPSPFASGVSWNQVNQYMYQLDQPASASSSLKGSLLQEVVFHPGLRPALPIDLIDQFESKRQRLADGYAPQSARDLVDWVKERLLIPEGEWKRLLAAIERDHPENGTIESAASPKLVRFKPPMARESLIAALEMVPSIYHCFYPELAKEAFRSLDDSPMPEIPSASERDDPALLFAEWFQFYGPRSQAFIESTLGLAGEQIEAMLQALIAERTLISGDLISDQRQSCFCDSETFEILLRQNRSRAKPVFQALPIEKLPLFMARQQGLIASGNTIDDLFQALERLVCLPLPADIWESDVFPSRIDSYQASFLDTIIQEGDLCWVGTGKQRIAFCFQTDRDMMQHPPKEETGTAEEGEAFPESLYMQTLLEGKEGRFHFTGLQQMSGRTPAELAEAIWQAVWSGHLTNDSFASLRKGVENRFRFKPVLHQESIQVRRGRRSAGRAAFAQWKDTLPYAGNWYLVPDAGPSDDLIEQEELNKDRVRLLLERYGLIFRELLARELPQFSWRALFRSLRLMELSGEILAGYFFKGIPGPQFISQQAFRTLQQPLPESEIYWMCAADPASLCGLQIESLKPSLPRRLSTTHLVFRGSELMLVSERSGKSLTIHCPPDDPRLQAYLAPLKHLLYRSFMPFKQIVIEEINQEAAAGSPYLDALKISFEVLPEFKKITLYRQI